MALRPSDFVTCHQIPRWTRDKATRFCRPELLKGWGNWIETVLMPDLRDGMRRVLLWMPWGMSEFDGELELDAYLLAKDAGLSFMADGFVEAWRPVIRDWNIEAIMYVGWKVDARTERAAVKRFRRSMQPLVDARCSVAFDASATYAAGSWQHREITRLRDAGTRVYVESWPPADAPHWHGLPVVCTAAAYANTGAAWAAKREQLGEVILWQSGPPEGDEWFPKNRTRWLHHLSEAYAAKGLTPAGSAEQWRWEGNGLRGPGQN